MGKEKKSKDTKEDITLEEKEQMLEEEIIEKELDMIDKLDGEIDVLQEKIAQERVENAGLQSELEQEKNDNKQLERENRRLKFSNSIFKVILFVIFTIVIFTCGWFIGTKLVDLDEYIYGDEIVNPLKDKEISFSQSSANEYLNKIFGSYMVYDGYIAKMLFNQSVPDTYDFYNVVEYKLAVVPKINEEVYGNGNAKFVTYDDYKSQYQKMYKDTSSLDDELTREKEQIKNYPQLLEEGKVIYNNVENAGVEVFFSAEKIYYTAEDRIYTMSGQYKELAGSNSILYGTAVNANFELKYKMDNDGTTYMIGMVINKVDENIEKWWFTFFFYFYMRNI